MRLHSCSHWMQGIDKAANCKKRPMFKPFPNILTYFCVLAKIRLVFGIIWHTLLCKIANHVILHGIRILANLHRFAGNSLHSASFRFVSGCFCKIPTITAKFQCISWRNKPRVSISACLFWFSRNTPPPHG